LSRRLLLVNLALLVAVYVVGSRAYDNWREARKRAALVLGQKPKPVAPPPMSPLPPVERVHAGSYAEIAQRTLFSPDRNPTVVVEVAAPKPMPPLPLAHGVLNLGDGAVAILSEKKGDRHKAYRPGEAVGEFKLLSVTPQDIVLEWDGKRIEKKVAELIDRSAPSPDSGDQAGAQRTAAPQPAQAPAAPQVSGPVGPGVDMGAGLKACQRGDNSPPGTVMNGLKKVVSESPFGQICRWEPVQ
jgi:hypothetical protein